MGRGGSELLSKALETFFKEGAEHEVAN